MQAGWEQLPERCRVTWPTRQTLANRLGRSSLCRWSVSATAFLGVTSLPVNLVVLKPLSYGLNFDSCLIWTYCRRCFLPKLESENAPGRSIQSRIDALAFETRPGPKSGCFGRSRRTWLARCGCEGIIDLCLQLKGLEGGQFSILHTY